MKLAVRAPADYPGCPVTVEEAIRAGRVLHAPRWGLADGFIPLLGAVLLSLIAAGAAMLMSLPTLAIIGIGLVAPWIALAGWPLVATAWMGNGPVVDLGIRLRGADWKWGGLGGLAAIATAVTVGGITVLIFGEFSSAAGDLVEELRAYGPVVLIAMAVFIVVGAPIVEELAFRGMLFAALTKRGVRPEWVIVISAALFSLFHLEPVRIPLLFALGLVFGYLRWKTRSLGAPVLAHAINNLPGAIGLLVGVG